VNAPVCCLACKDTPRLPPRHCLGYNPHGYGMPHLPRKLSVSPGTTVPQTTHALRSLYLFIKSIEEGEAGEAKRGKGCNCRLSERLCKNEKAEAREAIAEAQPAATRKEVNR
jgi:hypothetical protein